MCCMCVSGLSVGRSVRPSARPPACIVYAVALTSAVLSMKLAICVYANACPAISTVRAGYAAGNAKTHRGLLHLTRVVC